MLISLLSTIVYSTLFIRLVSAQNSNEPVDTSPDTCRCYCCPSIANPGGQIDRKCDPNNPPLTGTVPIGGGAGASACNPLACSGYFAAQCPPTNYASSRGAAVRAGCRSCPDGKYIFFKLNIL